MRHLLLLMLAISSMLLCSKKEEPVIITPPVVNDPLCEDKDFEYDEQMGCDGQVYPNPSNSPYRLPFPIGSTVRMGLTNCSSSFHSSGRPDQYAFDFDVAEWTPFYAARAGRVAVVEESKSSDGSSGDAGNYLIIAHDDNTYGLYYHSPKDGISVTVGQSVVQGQQLGFVGLSGFAGYPHLHFIVTEGNYLYPYKSVPITFSNVYPPNVVLHSFRTYDVCE